MRRLLTFCLIILALFNVSFRWPLSDFKVTSTFGESRADHFHDGIDLVCPSNNIYAVADGKLVFSWNKLYFPTENYWGGGNYKIISHGDKFSIYMHIEDGDSLKNEVKAEDIIAIMGNTGHSYGRHLHLSILDPVAKESINPLSLLPSLEDKKAPEVLGFFLKIGDKYTMLKDNSTIRLTQHYPLLVSIKDSISGKENLGIYKLQVIVNEKDMLNVDFSKISLTEKGLTVHNLPFYNLFDEQGYYKIDGIKYRQGENFVIVKASDYSGNTTEKTFKVFVNLDIK
jgi:hypothetical protein